MTTFGCESDGTSLVGLGMLQRKDPTGWARRLQVGPRRKLHPDHTLADWLRSGGDGSLSPPSRSWREQRAAAKRWLPHLDTKPVRALNEAWLHRVARGRIQAEPTGSIERWQRDCRFLRRWVRRAQLAQGCPGKVGKRWIAIPRARKARAPRMRLTASQIVQLLAATPDEHLRVQIGLAVGGRLTLGEIVRLTFADFRADGTEMLVADGCRRGARTEPWRVVAMPAWLVDLMRDAFGEYPPEEGLLFPLADNPRRPRGGSGDRLRRVTLRLGWSGPTFSDLRAFGQAVARSRGGSRALIRGAVGSDDDGRRRGQEAFEAEQRILAKAWKRLDDHELLTPEQLGVVPHRAPKGCRPGEPEIGVARRRIRERFGHVVRAPEIATLPPSCRPVGQRWAPQPKEPREIERRFQSDALCLQDANRGRELQAQLREANAAIEEARRLERQALAERDRAIAEVSGLRGRVEVAEADARYRDDEVGALVLAAGAAGVYVGQRLEQRLSRTG